MSWDGDDHRFLPAPVVGHTPELPYLGLPEALSTVYAYSQETARVVMLKQFADTRRRSIDLLEATTIDAATYDYLYNQSTIPVAAPCDSISAVLAFRTYLGAPTRVRMRLTVNATTATATDIVTPDHTGLNPSILGDRDVLPQQVIVSQLRTTAESFSSPPLLQVEVSTYGPILPEWLMIVRNA